MVDGKHLKFGKKRVAESTLSEMIGLSHGLVADGKVGQSEAEYLQKWLANRPVLADDPFLSGLYERVVDYLSDDFLDDDEAADLYETLLGITGGEFELGEAAKSSTLPLCKPMPELVFSEKRFCFTGSFNYGNRKACESAVKKHGAIAGSFTQKTNFLVVGTYATESWVTSSAGTKIIKAVDYRNRGFPISIVSESHWLSHLESA